MVPQDFYSLWDFYFFGEMVPWGLYSLRASISYQRVYIHFMQKGDMLAR